MSITRYLLFPLLCLGLVVTGCPQSGGGGGGGAGDDDDDDLPTDDDDASDDDDAVQEIPCDGTAATAGDNEAIAIEEGGSGVEAEQARLVGIRRDDVGCAQVDAVRGAAHVGGSAAGDGAGDRGGAEPVGGGRLAGALGA